jgi:hypothetical protein
MMCVSLRRAPCSVLWLQRNRITGPLPASLSALTSLAYVSAMLLTPALGSVEDVCCGLCAVWGWR